MNWLIPAGALVLGLVAGGYAASRWQAAGRTADGILGEPMVRRVLTAEIAQAVGVMFTEDCDHANRKSCPNCAERRTVQAAVFVVRETGGLK